MEPLKHENLHNGLRTDVSGKKKNFTKFSNLEVMSSQSKPDWKKAFPYEVNRKSSKSSRFLNEPVSTVGKIRSDALLGVQEKLSELLNQLEHQKKKLLQAEEENLMLQEQLLDHSKFTTSLGAILGNLLWPASHIPKVIDLWMTKFQLRCKFDEFLGAVNGIFSSFIKTYGEADLSIDSSECRFVMSLLGITANASAIPEGREFIATQSTGKKLIRNLIYYFSHLQPPPKLALWRLILTILSNISVNATGLQCLLDFQVADNVLSQCLKESTPKDLNLLCLNILQSITYDLTDPKHLREIILSIPCERIDEIALNGDHQIVIITKQIKKNLRRAKSTLHSNEQRLNDE